MMRRILALAVVAAPLAGEPKIDDMKKQAILIAAEHSLGDKSAGGTGSGFPVDARHLVTNWHVCCDAPRGAKTLLVAVFSEKDVVPAKPILISAAKDLAVLELEKPYSGPIPALAAARLLKEGQDVWAVGFPGASMRVGDKQSALIPTISKGIVSKFFSKPVAENLPPVSHVQVTAAVNPGNSGGPLFDECGNVGGIVVAKALSSLGQTRTFAEGVNLAIQIDELLPELDRLHIGYTPATKACSAGGVAPGISYLQMSSFAAAMMALFVALNKRTRQTVATSARRLTQRASPIPQPVHRPVATPPVSVTGRVMLRGVSGLYAGQKIPLSDKPCVLGRDPQVANLVFPADSPHVSKRHCQVRLDAGRVLIEDSWSSNGTFTAPGQRLASGQPRELRPGDRFYLGTQDNSFEVVNE